MIRKRIDNAAILLMVVICGVWGSQQVAIKSAADDMSPFLQVGLRSAIAALLIGLLFHRRDNIFGRLRERSIARMGTIVGLLFALEFVLVSVGITLTTASHMALYLYTAPLFSAVGLHIILPEERLSRLQWCGLGIAFFGIAVAVMWVAHDGNTQWSLAGDLCGLFAGIAWGTSSVVIRCSRLATIPSSCTLFYQLAITGIVLLLIGLMLGETTIHMTSTLMASLTFQTLVVAFSSYLIWFTLLHNYHVASLGTLVLMTPAMGIIAGVMFLGESLQPAFIVGALLILTGLLCVSLPSRAILRHRPGLNRSLK